MFIIPSWYTTKQCRVSTLLMPFLSVIEIEKFLFEVEFRRFDFFSWRIVNRDDHFNFPPLLNSTDDPPLIHIRSLVLDMGQFKYSSIRVLLIGEKIGNYNLCPKDGSITPWLAPYLGTRLIEFTVQVIKSTIDTKPKNVWSLLFRISLKKISLKDIKLLLVKKGHRMEPHSNSRPRVNFGVDPPNFNLCCPLFS